MMMMMMPRLGGIQPPYIDPNRQDGSTDLDYQGSTCTNRRSIPSYWTNPVDPYNGKYHPHNRRGGYCCWCCCYHYHSSHLRFLLPGESVVDGWFLSVMMIMMMMKMPSSLLLFRRHQQCDNDQGRTKGVVGWKPLSSSSWIRDGGSDDDEQRQFEDGKRMGLPWRCAGGGCRCTADRSSSYGLCVLSLENFTTTDWMMSSQCVCCSSCCGGDGLLQLQWWRCCLSYKTMLYGV